jgi:ComF family protein
MRPSFHLPAPCGLCAAWSSAAGLCGDCRARFARPRPRCLRCAIGVPEGVPLCGACLHTPLRFEQAIAAFDYAFPWDRVIAEFKFRGRLDWACPLAEVLASTVRPRGPDVDLVTAVPLAAQRLHERGYNQAWEIARRVAKRLGLPARHDVLLRWRDTPHQVQLGRRQRDANLRGAFMPGDADARAAVRGRCVALVDDVLTTGTTADEAASALLEAGARSVQLWVLARTERAND